MGEKSPQKYVEQSPSLRELVLWAILNSIFPSEHQFLVKPQAVIRPSVPIVSSIYLPPGSLLHPNASRSSSRIASIPYQPTHGHNVSISSQISTDSTGDFTLDRDDGGWEEALLIPDFLVVKGTESMDRDMILVVVEVKLDDSEEDTSINQVIGYIEAIQSKNYADEFVALLVMAQKTLVWRTEKQGSHRRQVLQSYSIETGAMAFCNHMLPLRQRYW